MASKQDKPEASTGRWLVVLVILLGVAAYTGLSLVDAATETRQLYKRLSLIQLQHDKLLEEQSRLNLERSSISSLQKVEEAALAELDMQFPGRVRGVDVD
ncbi:MAG: cell division protein FtsL [Pseudomonadota bacterium]